MDRRHAELIKAWKDGATIEYRTIVGARWVDVVGPPPWLDGIEYRIKPEKVYPETLMSGEELHEIARNVIIEGGAFAYSRYADRLAIANAAIRHAIDSGQVVVPESANSQQK